MDKAKQPDKKDDDQDGTEPEPLLEGGDEASPENDSAILSPEERGRIFNEHEHCEAAYRAESANVRTIQDKERDLSRTMSDVGSTMRGIGKALADYNASKAEVESLKVQAATATKVLTIFDKVVRIFGIRTKRLQAAEQSEERAQRSAGYHAKNFPPAAHPEEWSRKIAELEKDLTSLQVQLEAVRAQQETTQEKINALLKEKRELEDKVRRSTLEEQQQHIQKLRALPDGGRALGVKIDELDRFADSDHEWMPHDYAVAKQFYPFLSFGDFAKLADEARGEA